VDGSKAALAAAKARGQALGNPRLAEARAIDDLAHKTEADAHTAVVAPAIREAQAAGAKSLRQIAGAPECVRDRHGAEPLVVEFSMPLAASGPNTAIVVSFPSFGPGNTNAVVNVHGYQQ
jgi:hypothetical protein